MRQKGYPFTNLQFDDVQVRSENVFGTSPQLFSSGRNSDAARIRVCDFGTHVPGHIYTDNFVELSVPLDRCVNRGNSVYVRLMPGDNFRITHWCRSQNNQEFAVRNFADGVMTQEMIDAKKLSHFMGYAEYLGNACNHIAQVKNEQLSGRDVEAATKDVQFFADNCMDKMLSDVASGASDVRNPLDNKIILLSPSSDRGCGLGHQAVWNDAFGDDLLVMYTSASGSRSNGKLSFCEPAELPVVIGLYGNDGISHGMMVPAQRLPGVERLWKESSFEHWNDHGEWVLSQVQIAKETGDWSQFEVPDAVLDKSPRRLPEQPSGASPRGFDYGMDF